MKSAEVYLEVTKQSEQSAVHLELIAHRRGGLYYTEQPELWE